MKFLLFALAVFLSGCAGGPPEWRGDVTPAREAEYEPYLTGGTGSIEGQAYIDFFAAKGVRGMHRGAGSTVTLDPATKIGKIWWFNVVRTGKYYGGLVAGDYASKPFPSKGEYWLDPSLTPPSSGFVKARRTIVADADGNYKFSGLAAGEYYISTRIIFEAGEGHAKGRYFGGWLGELIKIRDGQTTHVTLNKFGWKTP